MQLFINNWSAALTASATAVAVQITVDPAEAAKLTGLGSGDYYLLTLALLDGGGAETAWEVVKVTGKASGVLDVVRGQEGSTALIWDSGAAISARATKGTLEMLRDSGGGGADVGSATPEPLGVASAGTSADASREDHVHAKPTPADIGAATTAAVAAKEQILAAGTNVTIDRTDPDNPIINASITGGGGGDVVGPASSANSGVALFDGITGELLKDGGLLGSAAASDASDFAPAAHVGSGGTAHSNAVDGGAAGFMSGSDKTKLNGVASGATANDTDANLKARANHTGTQAQSTIVGLVSDLAARVTNPMTSAADIIVGGASGAPTRLAKGAALQVLRVNAAGTALEYADESGGGGGGLTDITEEKNTASPNATVSVVALKNSATEANSDIAIIPKGSGAFLAAVPDDTSSGGGKRGINAVDLQTSRTNYNQVASGDKSVIVGGSACRAAGSHSIAGGGLAVATGIYSIALGGYSPSATGQWSVTIGGGYNSASADFATVIGGASLTASNTNSTTVGGEGNDSSGAFASVCGGAYAIARGYGAEARASGRFSATGDAQRERYILRRPTSSATPLELSANAAAKNASNQVVLQNSSAYAFSGKIVARSSSDSAAFSISGLITRGASAAATAFVGTPVVTLIAASAGASAWSISLSANTDYGCLVIQATGAASTNIKWVADVETVEVVG